MSAGILAPKLVDQRRLEVRRELEQQAKPPWTGLAVIVCEYRAHRVLTEVQTIPVLVIGPDEVALELVTPEYFTFVEYSA